MDFREYRGLTRNGIWIYGSLIYDKPFYTIRQNINLQSDVISDTVGQWTGCYDSNKVKIFEKDIVKNGDYLYVIEFEAPYYHAVRLSRDYGYVLSKYDDCVVVGNIYEDRWMMDLNQ